MADLVTCCDNINSTVLSSFSKATKIQFLPEIYFLRWHPYGKTLIKIGNFLIGLQVNDW